MTKYIFLPIERDEVYEVMFEEALDEFENGKTEIRTDTFDMLKRIEEKYMRSQST